MENNWISIKKLQPEIGQLALVNLGGYGRYYIASFDWYSREGGNHAWYTEADDVLHAATTDDYWIPIPKKNEFKVLAKICHRSNNIYLSYMMINCTRVNLSRTAGCLTNIHVPRHGMLITITSNLTQMTFGCNSQM